ncbi:hypothetical protein VTK56DRAFT_7478 [Thermocarpiscus australiensis]
MAPWPDRAGSRRPTDSDPVRSQQLSARPPHAGSTSGRLRSASLVTEFDALDTMHQSQGGSSSSDDDLHPPSRPQRPRHARSMSHPFPSLFSGWKKKSGTMAGSDISGADSDGEAGPSHSARGKPPPTRGHRAGSSVGSRDFTTGHCMTCGSLLRWPRELHVFKCTICLTINDLQPVGRDPRRDDAQEPVVASEDRASPNGNPISLDYTRSLIEHCLRSFLTSVLKRGAWGDLAVHDQEELVSSPSPISPGENRSPALPSTIPSSLRPVTSPTCEPRPIPSGSGAPGRHLRTPSLGGFLPGSCSTSYPEKWPALSDVSPRERGSRQTQPPGPRAEAKRIFGPLEDYIVGCFTSFHCLNSSFHSYRKNPYAEHGGDDARQRRPEQVEPRREPQRINHLIPELDPKLLLLGDFAENGTWWAGGQEEVIPGRTASTRSQNGQSVVSSRSPRLDWAELEEWYATAIEPARIWADVYESLVNEDPGFTASSATLQDLEAQILVGQDHVQKALLKACETILKRPGRRITGPHELRFLLILAANPLLHSSYKPYAGKFSHPENVLSAQASALTRATGPSSGRHSGIIKRIVGLMSNAPVECHNHLVAWFARYPERSFVQTKDLVSEFLSYRLIRQNEKKYEATVDITAGLIPSMGSSQSPASLHAALGQRSGSRRKRKEEKKKIVYQDDWQIKAAAQVLGLLFTANNMGSARRSLANLPSSPINSTRGHVYARGQILATSDFYMTLLDDMDLVADFEAWERKQNRFSFCQYPFLLSIGSKIQILEHDARRQMETKARDAFFDSILSNRVVQQFLVLNIRRECLVDDSLKAMSEAIGSGGEDIKKGLKIIFQGEEGVDAGGLRKEWFLLLVRELFNPDHGMFLYDEDSQYCYFNPNSLEPSEQFFLVGVVLGLAIYNSTILDVALPPFAFRKLLLAAPPPSVGTSQPRQSMTYSLDDLAEYRPRLAHGLRQLLDYDGDVESTFCLDFAIDTDRYGATERVALCPGGERRPVTNANRREYVDAYVRYLLDTAVTRQFEPFKRGFFTVCGGAALSLFRPEEIELLVRGSDEPLDVGALRAVAQYDGWEAGGDPAEHEPTVRWFWDAFERAPPPDQRRLLAFITGSDRIPAMGAASLAIRIACLGEDCGRFPTARTCFNSLGLWRCKTRERLEEVLWRAVGESEGFGLK